MKKYDKKTKYGQTIKNIRKKRDITQDEMAKKLGLSRPTYIAVEKGTRELSVSEFDVLSKVLGVSMEELELDSDKLSEICEHYWICYEWETRTLTNTNSVLTKVICPNCESIKTLNKKL